MIEDIAMSRFRFDYKWHHAFKYSDIPTTIKTIKPPTNCDRYTHFLTETYFNENEICFEICLIFCELLATIPKSIGFYFC